MSQDCPDFVPFPVHLHPMIKDTIVQLASGYMKLECEHAELRDELAAAKARAAECQRRAIAMLNRVRELRGGGQ